jgi:tRNA threonylcarbamoyladenosine biosynthesis protein TsaB
VTARRMHLCIDASAGPASVALFIDGVLSAHERIDRRGSAELLAPTVAAVLARAGVVAKDITDVVAGAGPGSFTGLRVAAALAKGLARGAGAALHAVPSLALIATADEDAVPGSRIAVLDALRGEWFAQRVTRASDGRWFVDPAVLRLPMADVQALAVAEGSEILGPPIDVAQQPDARGALRAGITAVSLDGWEPDYGRLAEAQVVWEAANARPLPSA